MCDYVGPGALTHEVGGGERWGLEHCETFGLGLGLGYTILLYIGTSVSGVIPCVSTDYKVMHRYEEGRLGSFHIWFHGNLRFVAWNPF